MHDATASISAILFDWGGVFCTPGEPLSHPAFAATERSIDDLSRASADIQQDYYCGRISTEAFWQSLIDRLDVRDVTPDDCSRAYLASYEIRPDMLALAAELKERYPTALLSNMTEVMLRDIEARFHARDYFRYAFFSNEIGCQKPDAQAYRIAIDALGTAPEHILFIDDSQKNTSAAAALGMPTILCTDPASCIAELRARTSARADHRPLK